MEYNGHIFQFNTMKVFDKFTQLTCAIVYTVTHTHSILTATIPGKPGLASFPLNFPSPLYS